MDIDKNQIFEVAVDVAGKYIVDTYLMKKKSDLKFNAMYYGAIEIVLPMVQKEIIKKFATTDKTQVFLVDLSLNISNNMVYKYSAYLGVYYALCMFTGRKFDAMGEFLILSASEFGGNYIVDMIKTDI